MRKPVRAIGYGIIVRSHAGPAPPTPGPTSERPSLILIYICDIVKRKQEECEIISAGVAGLLDAHVQPSILSECYTCEDYLGIQEACGTHSGRTNLSPTKEVCPTSAHDSGCMGSRNKVGVHESAAEATTNTVPAAVAISRGYEFPIAYASYETMAKREREEDEIPTDLPRGIPLSLLQISEADTLQSSRGPGTVC